MIQIAPKSFLGLLAQTPCAAVYTYSLKFADSAITLHGRQCTSAVECTLLLVYAEQMDVQIRIANEADAEAIIGIYGPYCDETTVSFELAAPTDEQMRERIRRVLESYPWIVAQIDGQVAGYVYASQHRERAAYRWAVDVAIYIAGQEHRRGIGQALYSALFSMLRKQGYFQAFAGITLPNPASVGLHERIGFRRCASFTRVGFKLGQWLDVGWWQLELQSQRSDPPEPCVFAAFREDPLVSSLLAEETQKLVQTLRKLPSKKS